MSTKNWLKAFLILGLFASNAFAHTLSAEAQTCPTSISFGATIQCTIDASGEVDRFTFVGAAGDIMRVRAIGTSGTLITHPGVEAPDSSTLCNAPVVDVEITCRLAVSGTHSITVRGESRTGTGRYSLYLQRLNSPVGCAPVTIGTLSAVNTIGVPGELDCFTFTAAVNDRLRVEVTPTLGTLWPLPEIVQPGGSTICELPLPLALPGTTNGTLTCSVLTAGTHLLLVGASQTGSYVVSLQRLNNPLGCAPSAFGAGQIAGSIDNAGELDCFSFSAVASDRIRVTATTTLGSTLYPLMEVVQTDGASICGPGSTSTSPYVGYGANLDCTVQTTGQHTLLLTGSGSTYYYPSYYGTGYGYPTTTSTPSTGRYSLSLQRLNSPVGCPTLVFGQAPVSGSVNGPNEVDCFTFSAPASAGIKIRATFPTSSPPSFEVLRPNGTSLCTSTSFYGTSYPPGPIGPTSYAEATCLTETAGTHAVFLRNASVGTTTSTYTIGLDCLSGGCPPLGGRSLRFSAGPTQLNWTGGTGQSGFQVWRLAMQSSHLDVLPTGGLPGTATSYLDSAPLTESAYCYAVVPTGSTGSLGLSDVECLLTNTRLGTAAVQSLSIQLNESNTATLTWSSAAGGTVTGLELRVIPLNGAAAQVIPISLGTVTASRDTTGIPTCFELSSLSGQTTVARADILCAIPGMSTLGSSGSTASTATRDSAVSIVDRLRALPTKAGLSKR